MATRFRNILGQRIRFADGPNAGQRMKDETCCCPCSGVPCDVPLSLFLDLGSRTYSITPSLRDFTIGDLTHSMTFYGDGITDTPGGLDMITNNGLCKFFGPEVGTVCLIVAGGGNGYNAPVRAYAALFQGRSQWGVGYAARTQLFGGDEVWEAFLSGLNHILVDTTSGGSGDCPFTTKEVQYGGDNFQTSFFSCGDGSFIGQGTVSFGSRLIRLYQ